MSRVQSVERAFSILEAIAPHPNGLGVTKIARQVNLPKSTVSRLLATLETVAAVERLPAMEGFRIGPGIVSLALAVPQARRLSAIARPAMLELARLTGEAVSLGLPDGDHTHFIDHVPSRHHIQVRDWTGHRFPMHVVSPGKLFLAHWPETALAGYLARPLERFTAQTVVNPAELQQQLAGIREQGCAWTIEEFEDGLTGVSAPIRNQAAQVIAAINVYGPSFRFQSQHIRDEITRLTITAADKVTGHIRQ